MIKLMLVLALLGLVYGDSSEYAKPGAQKGERKTTCNCGWRRHPMRRVHGGVTAGVNEFPMIAALFNAENGQARQFCGGTILTKKHVLTAAHCIRSRDKDTDVVTDKTPQQLRVLVGGHDYTMIVATPDHFLTVSDVVVHEDYDDRKLRNDIAMITVEKTIKYSEIVGPVCFPNSKLNLDKETVIGIGWGMTSWFGGSKGTQTTVLQKVHLTAYEVSTCEKFMPYVFDLQNKHQLCTNNKGKSVCPGDSGGPLLWYDAQIDRYTLVGVSSFVRSPDTSIGEEGCRDVAGFADPSAFIDWVKSKTSDESLCTKI